MTIEITHPEWILFGDECGADISQKQDGNVGGSKYLCQKGSRANIKSSHKDSRFKTMGITSATGAPVMYVLMISAEEITYSQRVGYDIYTHYDSNKSISDNYVPGKAYPGAPTCRFRGIDIPPLVTSSSSGGMTS